MIETGLTLFLFAFGMGVSFGMGFAVIMWLVSKIMQL